MVLYIRRNRYPTFPRICSLVDFALYFFFGEILSIPMDLEVSKTSIQEYEYTGVRLSLCHNLFIHYTQFTTSIDLNF